MTFTPNTLVFNGITKLLHFDTRWEDDEEILNFIRNSFELNENTEFNIVQLTQPFEGYVPPSLLKKPSDIEFRIDVIHPEIQDIETSETLNEKHIISQNDDDDDDDDDDDNDDLSFDEGKYVVYNMCGTG